MTQLGSGSYRPGGTMLHGLDAAVKLISFVLLCAAVLFTGTWAGHIANLFFTLALVYLSQMNRAEALAGVRRMRWPLIFIILLKFLFAVPQAAFFRYRIFCPSLPGLLSGLTVTLRLSLILVFAELLSFTTSPLKINEAIRTIVHPLSRIGLPTEHFAVMLGLTLRFIPLLFEEADNIRTAQRARGIGFEKENFFDTARASAPIALPLVLSAFRKAGELSMAMEARGYRMDGKGLVTEKIHMNVGEWYALLVSFALFALHVIVL